MPQLQTVEPYSTQPREPTHLESLLSGFSGQLNKNREQSRETDALRKIYDKYREDGYILEDAITSIRTEPDIPPTTRVSAIGELINAKKVNASLVKAADKNITKKTQASQPIDKEQLENIDQTLAMEGFNDLTPSEQNLSLIRNGVSKENAQAVIGPKIEEKKIEDERTKVLKKDQAKNDIGFYNTQMAKANQIAAKKKVLNEADIRNKEGASGGLWDQIMQAAGLLQFTSDGYRVFSSLAKDALKTSSPKDVVGSQMSQREFQFFVDATINPNFRKEANDLIIKKDLMYLRYDKLYSDITANIVEKNNGVIPERLQERANKEYFEQSKALDEEFRKINDDYNFIQHVPKGKVLMFDKKRRPMHVPDNEVERATKLGASLS